MRKCVRARKPKPNKINQNDKNNKIKQFLKRNPSECSLDAHYYLQQMSAQAQSLLIVAQRWFC